MFARIESGYKKIRRGFSRNNWMLRLLKLQDAAPENSITSTAGSHPAGLIMVQIDGLGRKQFERALRKGEMPFLKELLNKEHYALHDFYSGLPSSTPAVQGELFYGVKGVVPAFGYRHRGDGQLNKMFEPAVAQRVQRMLESQGPGLLAGGSAYSNIYTGGADESHFCAASMGVDDILQEVGKLNWFILALLNIPTLLRTIAFMGIEFVLAVIDFFRGLVSGKAFIPELKFIPARVFVSVLMRDLITAGASMDIARGLPVIHLNYLGYDEQSHRRGPDSAFAHWTLKGIDRCIASLWKVSHRYHKRHYDIWVYSDHGQEKTIPYQRLTGYTLQQAVNKVIEKLAPQFNQAFDVGSPDSSDKTTGYHRASLLQPHLSPDSKKAAQGGEGHKYTSRVSPLAIAIGPVGHVYLPDDTGTDLLERIAVQLVEAHRVPGAVVPQGKELVVFLAGGRYRLPGDEAAVFGVSHPFRELLTEDLVRLCHHQDAGAIVLLGCVHNQPAVSFPMENGSHAGVGPNETHAFALIPEDTRLCTDGPLRPLDLYRSGLDLLDDAADKKQRGNTPPVAPDHTDHLTLPLSVTAPPSRPLRVMTYNVHSCIGMDNIASPERVARVIARYRPDVVALQELDVSNPRSNEVHQAQRIADILNMQFHFHPARIAENEMYGDAVLSTPPMRLIKADALPQPAGRGTSEIRGAIWVEIGYQGTEIQLFNTHLGLRQSEREVQMQALAGADWLGHPDCLGAVVLCGDFNALPGSKALKKLTPEFKDVRRVNGSAANTFTSRLPVLPIDHIFVNSAVKPVSVEVADTALVRVASDHLPLVSELNF